MPLDVPIYEDGKPTGRTVAVSDPPPLRWDADGLRLELKILEVCRRFGCGCFWEEVSAYVPEGREPTISAAVRIKPDENRRRT
jgi:hypothetical protein